MSAMTKSTYLYIFTSVVIFETFGWWIFGVLEVQYFTGPEALTRIGKAISILIVAGYAFEWTCLFGVAIFSAKVLKNTKEDFTVNERDKQILHKSMHASHTVLTAGLCFSVFAMAMGVTPFWVFHAMLLASRTFNIVELRLSSAIIRGA